MTQKKKKTRKHWTMPRRLWNTQRRTLNYQQKHLLSFIWWSQPQGCRLWDRELAEKFEVSPRTIRRWLSVLKALCLISISQPKGRNRIIYPLIDTIISTPEACE